MALKLNILTNYASQIYNGIIGIIVMPFYLKLLGAESYGLIAFFTLLQTWFYLLDIGLSQTLSRETVRFRTNVLSAVYYQRLLKYIQRIFYTLALLLMIILSLANQWVATKWLKISQLPLEQVLICLQVMFVCAGLRCVGGIYRSVIQGFERIVWISVFNIIINSLRFLAVIPVLYFYDFSIQSYFYFQLIVAILELFVLWCYQRVLIRQHKEKQKILAIQFTENGKDYFYTIVHFALLSAMNFILWLGISQSDKLLMSAILSLSDYAYYSIAILLASVIYLISTPMSNVLLPRMTALYAEQKIEQLERIYHQFAQFILAIVATVAWTIFWNAEQVVWVWSQDFHTSTQVADVLRLYVLGNMFFALSAFSYYIQYAHGDVKRHFYGNLIFLALIIPSVYWAGMHYHAVGTGWVWLVLNILWFLCWTLWINRHFIQHYWRWSLELLWIMVVVAIGASVVHYLYEVFGVFAQHWWWNLLALMLFTAIVLVGAVCSAPMMWRYLIPKIKYKWHK